MQNRDFVRLKLKMSVSDVVVDKDKLLPTVYKAHPRRHLQHKNETTQKASVSEDKTPEDIQEGTTEKTTNKFRPPAGGFMLPANFDMSQARNNLKKSAKTENSEKSSDDNPSTLKRTQTYSSGVKRTDFSEKNTEQELRKKISDLEEQRKKWEEEKTQAAEKEEKFRIEVEKFHNEVEKFHKQLTVFHEEKKSFEALQEKFEEEKIKFHKEISQEKSELENQWTKFRAEQEKISSEKIPLGKIPEEEVKIPEEEEKISQENYKVSEIKNIVDVPEKIVEKIVEKISEKKQIDTEELLKIENQHSEIQAEIENLKKIAENYQKRLETEKAENAAIFEWFGKNLGNGDRDLGKIISEIVREEILVRENSRTKNNVEEVTSLIVAQVSELNSKLTQISEQNQKLEKNLALCKSEIAEVKNNMQDENEHHKSSLDIALKNFSEEIDIKLQSFTDISPENSVLQNSHQISTKSFNVENIPEERKIVQEKKDEEESKQKDEEKKKKNS